jgi:glyoxylase-like metal-dependent hydrolase (beta-lactamase superfamily II)
MTEKMQDSSEKMESKVEKISKNIFKLGPLGDPKVLCSYLILDESVSIVDCGPSVVIDELLSLAAICGIQPSDIDNLLLTHIHLDHAGGTAEFAKRCPSAKIYVPRRGFKHLIDPSILNPSAQAILGNMLFDYWGAASPVPESRVSSMDANANVDIGSQNVQYIEAMGHAPHHDVLLMDRTKVLFAADALGIHDDQISEFHSPTSPPPSFNLDRQSNDFEMIKNLVPSLICLAHFKTLKPTNQFFLDTIKLYKTWELVIGQYLSEKRIKGASLGTDDLEAIYSILKREYPGYGLVPERLDHQIKKVDIAGFAQWFDFKASRSVDLKSK